MHPRARARTRRRLVGRRRCVALAFELRDDRVDAVRDALVVVAGLELRRHHVADDAARRDVGQRAFETVTDFDAHLAVLRHDDDQHAVVLAFLPELPVLEHLGRVFLDRLAADRRHGQHRDLIARRLLVRLERGGRACRASPASGSRRCRRRGRSETERRPRAATERQRDPREQRNRRRSRSASRRRESSRHLALRSAGRASSFVGAGAARNPCRAASRRARSSPARNASAKRPAAQQRRHRARSPRASPARRRGRAGRRRGGSRPCARTGRPESGCRCARVS